MTEFGVRIARHEDFPTLLTDPFKRWTHVLTRFQPTIPLPAADALLPEPFLFLQFFLRQFGGREIEFSDEFQIDVNFLHPVTIRAVRRMDNDFINKLVEHRRGKFIKAGVLLG